MRNAYALLGLSFLIVFGGAFLVFERANAPTEPIGTHNNNETMSLILTSTAFENGQTIPKKYTCDGENISPPLSVANIPEGTKSLILVMDDRDLPMEIKTAHSIEKFDHWVLYNLPVTEHIEEGINIGSVGQNSSGTSTYVAPCPPTEYEPTEHRYVFRLYAVSGTLNFIKAPTLDEVEEAAKGMMLDSAELIGVYDRNK